jgi:hypothetical protein
MSSNETRLTRFEIAIALSIALVSITTAIVAGRASAVGSAAGDASRRGLIDAIRQQAAMSENWRLVYQEAAFAQEHAASFAELEVLAESSDAAEQAQANEVAENLLPSLAQLSPFVTDSRYRRPDGSLDLDLRFQDVEAESPDLAALSPETSFREADRRLGEQRWLTMGSALLVISLFWLTLAEIARGRARAAAFAIGLIIYLASLASLGLVEAIYVLSALGGAQ